MTLLSSRFEGFDERIVTHLCSDAISIGPYVLSGGELPAMVLLDAIARRLPGALAEGSGEHESFSLELAGGSSIRTTRDPQSSAAGPRPTSFSPATTAGSTSGGASRAVNGAPGERPLRKPRPRS